MLKVFQKRTEGSDMDTLKTIRAERGLSMDDVATRTGVGKTSLWNLECGGPPPSGPWRN